MRRLVHAAALIRVDALVTLVLDATLFEKVESPRHAAPAGRMGAASAAE